MSAHSQALVSIVIPCYNQARYLGTSISSAFQQTRSPVEVIVVDDGSTDDSAAVAVAHGASVVRQTNAGVSAARNAGLAVAHGEIVVFLDADDELLPTAVETGVAALQAHPEAVCAVGRTSPMDDAGRDLPSQPPHPVPANLYRTWLSENFVSTPGAAVFRRVPLQEMGGFPKSVGPAADYAVYLQLARAGRVVDHGQVVVRYRSHPHSMSRNAPHMLRMTMRVLRNERKRLPPGYETDFNRARVRWATWYGLQTLESVRAEQRAGNAHLSHLAALATLARYCPRLLLDRIRRNLTRTIRPTGAARSRSSK